MKGKEERKTGKGRKGKRGNWEDRNGAGRGVGTREGFGKVRGKNKRRVERARP